MSARGLARAWAPALFYMGLIWTVSSLSFDGPIRPPPIHDKLVHFIEYGILGLLLAHACFRTWPRHHPLRTATLAVVATVLWGWLDEIHQAFVPGRSAEALDLVADSAGAIAGAAARAALARLSRTLPSPPRTAEE